MSNETMRRWPGKLVIGLTGNIATGKSAVRRMAAEKGALTLDADQVVHHILDHDAGMQAAIAVAFGSEVRHPDGRIDRPRLAAIVFNDEAALRDLEGMLHPAVRQEMLDRIDRSKAPVVMVEAIKLLEGELRHICQQIWVTHCDRARQIERLVICRGLDEATAILRVNAQSPQAEKVAQADVVIDTGGTLAETRAQFEAAWAELPAPLEAEQGSVTVRRARPADVPAILLHMQKASGGKVNLRRSDLLHSMARVSYLIGQTGSEISTIIAWTADSAVARIEHIYVYPEEKASLTTAPVLAEVEESATELICEAILAFPDRDCPASVRRSLDDAGFLPQAMDQLPRLWRQAATESQPAGTELLVKVLRQVRVR